MKWDGAFSSVGDYGRVNLRPSAAEQFNTATRGGHRMAWTTPTLVEICVGLEINGYLPAEF